MSKTTACIKMLQRLRARGFCTREELANELHCNIRNVIEYKKELEKAGYEIESVTGIYGGYQFKSGTLLPVFELLPEEAKALQEGRSYLESHQEFLSYPDFEKAMDKIQANIPNKKEETGIFMGQGSIVISEKMQRMIHACEFARKEHLVMEITYRSMSAKYFTKVKIHPYEILNYQGAYYCLAYSLKAKGYRNFKFSEERMKEVHTTRATFLRDPDFHVLDHIGKSGLVKDDVYALDLILHKETALLISEKQVGIDPHKEWISSDSLHFTTIMEGKLDTIKFLLSLGNQCEVVAPVELKDEIYKILQDMTRLYSYS